MVPTEFDLKEDHALASHQDNSLVSDGSGFSYMVEEVPKLEYVLSSPLPDLMYARAFVTRPSRKTYE